MWEHGKEVLALPKWDGKYDEIQELSQYVTNACTVIDSGPVFNSML